MEELIDIYDADMNHIGVMEKKRAHAERQWHKGAHIWIADGKNVLVQLRAPNVFQYPNMWSFSAAGHLKAGDNPLTGAKREYEEELGLEWTFGDIKEDCIINFGEMRDGNFENEFIYLYFLKAKLDLTKLKIQQEEVADIKYIPYDQFVASWDRADFHTSVFPQHYKETVLNGLAKLLD